MERHYEALGLPPTADEREVRRAYRTLLKEHHPDQGGSRERFLQIQTAYEELVGERPPERELESRPLTDRSTSARPRRPTYDPNEVPDADARDSYRELTVGGSELSLTLVGLVHGVSLEALVDDHVPAATERTVAFFRVHNTGSDPLSWCGRANTSFIGDDGFLYEGSSVATPHADSLPERWCGIDVEIEPGRALDAVVIAQEVPTDAAIEQVLYTHRVARDGETDETERYLFELRPLVRERLDRLPF